MVAVTYNAPKGDEKVVEIAGLTFFDGQSQDIDADEHAGFLAKAKKNQHFKVEGAEQKVDNSKVNLKASIENARDHDFEQDQRLEGKNIAELRELAEKRGINHEGMSKPDLREALSK